MFKQFRRKKQFSYKCHECGKTHKGSPSFALERPTYYFDVPEAERADRIFATDDLCRIKPADGDVDSAPIYCIRVTMDIPIIGAQDPFTWGVWVTQSKDSFDKYVETFDQDQSSLSSFGWLPVDLPFYDEGAEGDGLEHLECEVRWGEAGQRPKLHLWESSHPLSVDQRNGVNWSKAMTIANAVISVNDGQEHPC